MPQESDGELCCMSFLFKPWSHLSLGFTSSPKCERIGALYRISKCISFMQEQMLENVYVPGFVFINMSVTGHLSNAPSLSKYKVISWK